MQLSRDPDLWKHIVFVEDYDMKIARELVQGVDLWLNTPRRGEEACGTCGMKAAMNGVLNLSVLDGWFDEAYETSGGWAIGDREDYSEDQDAIHASNIYYLLEREIVPHVLCAVRRRALLRMGEAHEDQHDEPDARLRRPPHGSRLCGTALRSSPQSLGTDRGRTISRGPAAFPMERASSRNLAPGQLHGSGTRADRVPSPAGVPVEVRAALRLAGLKPEDLRVECVIGRIGSSGGLEETEVVLLPEQIGRGRCRRIRAQIVPAQTGRLGLRRPREPEPLRRSADPACHQSAEVGARLQLFSLRPGFAFAGSKILGSGSTAVNAVKSGSSVNRSHRLAAVLSIRFNGGRCSNSKMVRSNPGTLEFVRET